LSVPWGLLTAPTGRFDAVIRLIEARCLGCRRQAMMEAEGLVADFN
jgi:hypothetical protein